MNFNVVAKDGGVLPLINSCNCEACKAPWPETAPEKIESWFAYDARMRRTTNEALEAALSGASNGITNDEPWVEDPDLPPIDLTPRYRKDTPRVPKGTQTVIYSSEAPSGWRVVSVDGSKLVIERE